MRWKITLWQLFLLGSSFNCTGAVVVVGALTSQSVNLGSIPLSNHANTKKVVFKDLQCYI